MPRSGGRTPYDKLNALTGPARVVWAETSVAVPADLSSVVDSVATNGEYPLKTGWTDFGLAADAPSYSHDKDTEGLEYQQPSGFLFEEITELSRSFTAQVAEIDPENLKIIENSTQQTAVAASAAAATTATKKAAQTLVHAGLYTSFRQLRIVLISYRPTGAGMITEGTSGVTRPCAVARIIPLCTLAAEESELSFEKGEPTNAEVTFTALPDQALGAGKEHGFWSIETPGTILQ